MDVCISKDVDKGCNDIDKSESDAGTIKFGTKRFGDWANSKQNSKKTNIKFY